MAGRTASSRAAVVSLFLFTARWGVPPLQTARESEAEAFVKPDFRPVYRPAFDKVYRLEKGQVLKRVAPPFIPEREVYYLVEHEHQARHIRQPPEYFTFHYTEEKGLRNWGLGFGGDTRPLSDVMDHTLGMESYQFEGPKELLSLDLPGDWVVRPDATEAEKLAALGRIASDAHGRLVRFERRDVERDVILATGKYRFTPIDGTFDKDAVHLFVGGPDADEGSGGGSGDLPEFLRMIGNRVGVPVIDRTDKPPLETISWRHHSSAYLTRQPTGPGRQAELTTLLERVSKQTGLRFERARRKVPVWVVSEGPAAG